MKIIQYILSKLITNRANCLIQPDILVGSFRCLVKFTVHVWNVSRLVDLLEVTLVLWPFWHAKNEFGTQLNLYRKLFVQNLLTNSKHAPENLPSKERFVCKQPTPDQICSWINNYVIYVAYEYVLIFSSIYNNVHNNLLKPYIWVLWFQVLVRLIEILDTGPTVNHILKSWKKFTWVILVPW